jgi:acyl-CoA thioester hydrolase
MRVRLQPRYSDYDSRGHVNNAVYLTYFEIGRVYAWLEAVGHTDPNFIIAEARITYRSPAMLGEPLAIEVTTSEIRSKTWVWSYRVLDERDDRVVAEGATTQVMYDYRDRKSVAIPDDLRVALERI